MILLNTNTSPSGMDASAWVAVVAATVALIAVAVAVWQAWSAKAQARAAQSQAQSAKAQAESATSQAESAKRQAEAAVRQTELQERVHHDSKQPYIWADFRPDLTQGSLIRLVVRNEGPTVAEDVRVVFDPPLQGVGITRDLTSVHHQLANGLRSLPPGREMIWNFAMGHKLFEAGSEVPRQYRVTITGRGPYGEMQPAEYELDLDDMSAMAAPAYGSLKGITDAINKLER